jgi:hypothetical protein
MAKQKPKFRYVVSATNLTRQTIAPGETTMKGRTGIGGYLLSKPLRTLDEAIKQLKEWEAAGYREFTLSTTTDIGFGLDNLEAGGPQL